jgi:hypothetical protein
MDDLLTFVQAQPDVRVAVAADAPMLYMDRSKGRTYSAQQVAQICAEMGDTITHQEFDGAWLSPAEVFSLAVRCLAARIRDGSWPGELPYRYVDGPVASPSVELVSEHLSLDDVFGTCLYEDAYLGLHGRMPSQVQVGRNWLAPADFLATIGAAIPRWVGGEDSDASIVVGDFVQAEYVEAHVEWGWTVFPPCFNADPLLEVGRLQTWTLKPSPLTQ